MTGKTESVSGSVHTKLSGINFEGQKSPALFSKFSQKKWIKNDLITEIFLQLNIIEKLILFPNLEVFFCPILLKTNYRLIMWIDLILIKVKYIELSYKRLNYLNY